jgi:hypothetical protein
MRGALLDENFDNDVLRGLLRIQPDLDIIRVQDIPEIAGADDPTVLAWAAENNRILFTHDAETMTHYAYERVRAGLPMPGVFEVRQTAALGQIIEDMLTIILLSTDDEWEAQVRYLPLR